MNNYSESTGIPGDCLGPTGTPVTLTRKDKEGKECERGPFVSTHVRLSFEPYTCPVATDTFLFCNAQSRAPLSPKVTKDRVFPAAGPGMAFNPGRALAVAREGHLS